MQPIIQTAYNMNNEPSVHYSSHDLNKEPFDEQTILDHLNTELVCSSLHWLDLVSLLKDVFLAKESQ